MASTKFFTNEDTNTLLEKFKGIFEHNLDIEKFDALVGYFRASGYFQIRPFLENVPNIRVLVGIDVDKIIAKYQSKGLLFQGDSAQTLTEFMSDMKSDIQKSAYNKRTEDGIVQLVDDIISKKVEIKAHPTKKLHAKIYIFRPKGWNEHKMGSVITGSSNLTENGLGGGKSTNYEFNVQLNDYEDIKFAGEEFEKLWLEGVAILPIDVQNIKKDTFLNDNFTPFEVYMKFLIEYFGKSVEFDPNSIADLPDGFKRLSYQVDAVKEGYSLLEKHNGFFLSDVVGLGKTIVGTLIAKKFFYSNDFPNHISNTLIIVPPALRNNWEETLNKFQLNNFKIITNGSLHKVTNADKYDLIIVDEAHKFRNDTAEAYNELQKICKTRTRRTLKDGTKAQKKVILISATPLNNRPEDIANQVYLFQDAKDSTLEVTNLQHFFRKHIDEYKKLNHNPNIKEVQEEVKKIYKEIREKVIQPITVRRTRTDLNEHEMYKSDLDEQGIVFPNIKKPEKIFYELDNELDALYDKTIFLLSNKTEGIQYYRYQAIKYLKAEKKNKYKNADVASQALAKIMKTMLVKRIDSSFYAFKQSLNRFKVATEAMVKMFNDGRVFIAPKLNVTEYVMEEKEEELIALMMDLQLTDPTIEILAADDFKSEFYDGLVHDLQLLTELNAAWKDVDKDPKIDEFIHRVDNELLDLKINPTQKLVIFSESKETTNHITKKLRDEGRTDILEVHSGNRDKLQPIIKENFDANIPLKDYKDDFNIIIATEVLAEGINLHRANVIVNYDTPWNSTRLMQRIGRVNRIGSTAPFIHVYNFYPTAKVNNDIELEKKAIMKLQAFHSALGEDSEIYSPDEETQSFGLFDKDVDEEKDEKLGLLMELRKFKAQDPELFRQIQNMPLRARTGRKSVSLANSTVCFMRNQRHNIFYYIRADGSFDEIAFIEAANLFRATKHEKGVGLHSNHHKQINIVLEDFKAKIDTDLAIDSLVDTTQGPNEKKALAYLDGFLSLPFISKEEKELIKAAKNAIKVGKFQQLQREVNKLKRSTKTVKLKPVDLLDALLKILNQYPLKDKDLKDDRPVISVRSFEKFKPEIIISESFSSK
jgi:SNF2 family DNA or RNA helicase